MTSRLLFIIIFVLQSLVVKANSEEFGLYDSFFKNINTLNFENNSSSKALLDKSTSRTKNLLLLNYLVSNNGEIIVKRPELELTKNNFDNSIINLIFGYYDLLYKSERTNSYQYFLNAYTQARKTDYHLLINFCLKSLLTFYSRSSLQNDNDYLEFLNLYKNSCSNINDWLHYYSFSFNLLGQTTLYNEKKTKLKSKYDVIFKSYDSIFQNEPGHKLKSIYFMDKGNYFIRDNPNYAKKFYKNSLTFIDNSNYFLVTKFKALLNLARVASLSGNYQKGVNYLHQSSKYININDSLRYLYNQKAFLADLHAKLKQYDSAYYYARKVRFLGYQYKFLQHNTIISKTKVQIETLEKEKENLELKQQNLVSEQKRKETELDKKQTQNFLYISLLFLLLGTIIAYLNIKNSRKKQLLAEQQKELEKQKNLTLLKEQEITTINAMVAGQEKERIRIAEDLHDNIGSVLATLKLHFENLKLNREKKHFNQEELYNKTEKLIDETYLKVRSIAHAKNAGVIANKGLLVAVKIMAEKVSSANQLHIEIVDFGLDKRLDTNTEITVFRIIQELITNVIKHAEASEATINLSLFDESLNIIIEDNGKGFNPKKIKTENGMGLGSIKKRIEHVNGTFQVDSVLKRGTSIIINIPV
ncbi:two-component system, NarL family, sensor histidine kinase DegS [Tenacibaculum sp. 190524A05c]|uniref:sensor histidine kinase n=1 Tax=Tenacibaculum platacis TaxID=3137852 RepID=UPI0031FAC660